MAIGRTYSVTQLNQEIKGLLESNPSFQNLFVRGEISNYKAHSSGHLYFTLKDDGAAISAVMFRSDAMRLKFMPQNGVKVVVRGRVSSFPKSGQVQIYASEMIPEGAGALHLAFEQLKEKLYGEGLFETAHKRELPTFPRKIALVTSPTGAAVQDMLRILKRRWPLAEVLIYPSLVQGKDAPASLVKAISYVNQDKLADIMIVGRGGGSLEDLWAFNEESVARAIYASAIPVISAVGHEPDVTISDFVADLRAPTPSGAAELAVPDKNDIYESCSFLQQRLLRAGSQVLLQKKTGAENLSARLYVQTPMRYLNDKRKTVAEIEQRLGRAAAAAMADYRLSIDLQIQKVSLLLRNMLFACRASLAKNCAALDALSPLRVLGRGYSVALNDKKIAITDSSLLSAGDKIQIKFLKGSASCTVCDLEKE